MSQFACIAAFASIPADDLLAELMKDDRLVLHHEIYRQGLSQNMDLLQDLPMEVWVAVAVLCGKASGPILRSQALSAAHTSLGFIHHRIWAAVHAYPWKLAAGDRTKNLLDLAAMEEPPAQESVTRKVWYLVREGFPQEQLVEALGLLLHLGWSSATVEQQHASATQIKNRHKMFTMNSIMARALIHTSRLFFAVEPVGKAISRWEQKLHGAPSAEALPGEGQ